jgi:hypothetical protein
MSDIRIYGNVSGDVIIGEYIDASEDTGELISIDGSDTIGQTGRKVLRDPMMVSIQAIPPQGPGQQPRMIPVVQPINMYADTIRGSVGDIDIEANNLVEFKKIGLEKIQFLVNQYNEILTGLDLNSGGNISSLLL